MQLDTRLGRLPARPRLSATALVAAFVTAVLLLGMTTTVALGATTLTPKCDSVNVRTGPGTTYAKKATLRLGAKVTVVATVSGRSYVTKCGRWVSGSAWYKISAVNGTSTKSLYGVSYVYGASKLFKATASTAPSPSPTLTPSPAPVAESSATASAAPAGSPAADPSADPTPGASGPTLPDGVTPLGDTVQFFGRGYGHGVGLSQYGAYGRAAAGQSVAKILAHYYPGTTLRTTTNATIRVLVLSGFAARASNPLQIYGRNGGWTIDGVTGTFPADAQLQVVRDTTTGSGWRLKVTASDGSSLLARPAPTMPFYVRPAASASVLQLYSKPSAYDRYRGLLRVIATSAGTLNVVNVLPLESYLRGAVPAEMPASWSAEALKSQAIAARSYAAYRMRGKGTFDIYDDTRSQVYRGQLAEKGSTNAAVSATAGRVVATSSGAVANTLYHSADGGATENNENVFVSATGGIVAGKVSYLRGSSDRAANGTAYDKASPYDTWKTTTYTLADIQAAFAADSRTDVGTLVGLDLRRRGVSGRLISVTLYGADGTTRTVSGGVFISVFNAETPADDPAMRNTLFDLAPIP